MKLITDYSMVHKTLVKKLGADVGYLEFGRDVCGNVRYKLGFIYGQCDDYRWDKVTSRWKYPRSIWFAIDFMIQAQIAELKDTYEEIDVDGDYEHLHGLSWMAQHSGDDVISEFSFYSDIDLWKITSMDECWINCDIRGMRSDERKLIGYFTWLRIQGAANKGN